MYRKKRKLRCEEVKVRKHFSSSLTDVTHKKGWARNWLDRAALFPSSKQERPTIKVCPSFENLPVAPNTLPLANSHMPAMNCKRPPAKIAIPTITFGVLTPRVLTLNIDRRNVVAAKENIPLQAKG